MASISEWRMRRPDTAIVAVVRTPGPADEGLRLSGADAVLHAPVVLAHVERVILQLLRLPERRPPAGV
jgi:hypothetical protein